MSQQRQVLFEIGDNKFGPVIVRDESGAIKAMTPRKIHGTGVHLLSPVDVIIEPGQETDLHVLPESGSFEIRWHNRISLLSLAAIDPIAAASVLAADPRATHAECTCSHTATIDVTPAEVPAPASAEA